MVRSLRFLEYKSELWFERARQRTDLPQDIQSGILAYAHKQSHLCKKMAEKFSSHWVGLAEPQQIEAAFELASGISSYPLYTDSNQAAEDTGNKPTFDCKKRNPEGLQWM